MLDEPTAGMSAAETRDAIRLLERIVAERELTLLFTEHDMDVVFSIAQKITLNSPLFETADPTDVLLKEFAISIDASQTDKFSFMKNRLDDVRIVGFGEDTHGTAEFTELAVELMIYLAEDHGYRTFIIENGFGETTYLNDFINGRTNEAEVVLKTKISTWRYQTTQFVGLLNRLRQYNQTLPEKSIQLFGMEMHYPHEEAKLLNQYLSKCGHSRFNSVGTVSDDVGCDHSEHDTDP